MRTLMSIVWILVVSALGWSQVPLPIPVPDLIPTVIRPIPTEPYLTFSVVDGAGNLVVFDSPYASVPVPLATPRTGTVTGDFVATAPALPGRITIVRPAGSPETAKFDNTSFHVLGAGSQAVYALMNITPATSATSTTSPTQKLIALLPNQSLPTSADRFISLAIDVPGDVGFSAPDFISIIRRVPADPTAAAAAQKQIDELRAQLTMLFNQLIAATNARDTALMRQITAAINAINEQIRKLMEEFQKTVRQSQVYRFNGTRFEQVGATATLP